MTDYPLIGVVRVTWSVFLIFAPIISLELVKLGTSTFVCWLMHRSTSAWVIYYPPKGMCSESRDLFLFWEISDNILLMVQDRD